MIRRIKPKSLSVVVGNDFYLFRYDDASSEAVIQAFGRFASNPDLNFSWYSAAFLSQQVRKNQTASRLAAKQ